MLETIQETTGPEKSDMELSLETGQSHLDLAKIIEGIPAWVQVCSLDGTILMVNQAATRISGCERREMEGQCWPYPWFVKSGPSSGYEQGWGTDCWPSAELERSGSIPEFEATYTTPQNNTRFLGITLSLLRDDLGQPQHVLMVAWDHTQRKAREEELAQALKIQAVNQLASGIAHDVNNNLAVILGYSEFLLSTSESFGDVVRQALASVRDQSVECATTVRRIQSFSRTVPRSQFGDFSVNDVVREVIDSTESGWRDQPRDEGAEISIETDLADLAPIFAYYDGLREALAALMDNAVDALPQGGKISFKTGKCGDEVVVAIRDNGAGIAELDLQHIFDAFYTTKGPARSGLGLSIAYNLVVQQGGKISVSSERSQGSTFVIRLPDGKGNSDGNSSDQQVKSSKFVNILVVDDEPLVADVFRTFLQSFGHQVSTCLSASEALESLAQHHFDLALVDLGMPNMDGWELSRQINRQYPGFPIIVATGWNVSVEDGQDQGAEIEAVLKKPFGMQELAKTVRDVLQ